MFVTDRGNESSDRVHVVESCKVSSTGGLGGEQPLCFCSLLGSF